MSARYEISQVDCHQTLWDLSQRSTTLLEAFNALAFQQPDMHEIECRKKRNGRDKTFSALLQTSSSVQWEVLPRSTITELPSHSHFLKFAKSLDFDKRQYAHAYEESMLKFFLDQRSMQEQRFLTWELEITHELAHQEPFRDLSWGEYASISLIQ